MIAKVCECLNTLIHTHDSKSMSFQNIYATHHYNNKLIQSDNAKNKHHFSPLEKRQWSEPHQESHSHNGARTAATATSQTSTLSLHLSRDCHVEPNDHQWDTRYAPHTHNDRAWLTRMDELSNWTPLQESPMAKLLEPKGLQEKIPLRQTLLQASKHTSRCTGIRTSIHCRRQATTTPAFATSIETQISKYTDQNTELTPRNNNTRHGGGTARRATG